jgi:hypothetical protein
VTGTCPVERTLLTARTNAGGVYQFPADLVPSTDDNTWYRLVYLSPSDAPDGKLLLWRSEDLEVYTQGTQFTFDTFDIADVTLLSPNSATPQSLPIQFAWNARSAGTDYYLWQLYDRKFTPIALERPALLHSTPSFTLTVASDPQLKPGSSLADGRFWDIVVATPAGYGNSWNINQVAFSSAAADQAALFKARRELAEHIVSAPYLWMGRGR